MSELMEVGNLIDEDTQKDKYLTFVIENESYGIEIKHVTEIIGIQNVTEVPDLPDFIRGIINLRGKIIPVMDVRTRFKKEFLNYNDRTCIIVIDIDQISMGLIVDTVSEVLNISEENVVLPPKSRTGFSNRYVKAIGKVDDNVKLILDCQKLLKEDELEELISVS